MFPIIFHLVELFSLMSINAPGPGKLFAVGIKSKIMRSKAHIKSHPLHPILVTFPIAFFTGSFLFDIAGWIFQKEQLHRSAYYMEIAGVGFGLLAAVPGILDFLYTVPPKSSAKKRAAMHGSINAAMVTLFLIAWLYRQRDDASLYLVLLFELAGVILLFVAGWMGGTLVYRNHIGVDIRYADAGKWKEEFIDEGQEPFLVAKMDELKANQMKLLRIGEKRIVLGRTEKSYVAFDDRCTHKGGSLAAGSMICDRVHCPWHGSQFDVYNGSVTAGPAQEKIKTYTVTEKDGNIYLSI